uniref:Uncharacterized protein n=1 Tax=Rhizophora mucronata TaxID=61149 RepID=A0A2P2QA21_RHIMU
MCTTAYCELKFKIFRTNCIGRLSSLSWHIATCKNTVTKTKKTERHNLFLISFRSRQLILLI